MYIKQTKNLVIIGTHFRTAWDLKVRELLHNGYEFIGLMKTLPYEYAGVFRKIDSEDTDSTPDR